MSDARPCLSLLRAADFAATQHRDQRRKDADTPYVNHPIAVARRLAETGGVDDPVALAAALLHDTIEDTGATRSQLEREFGAEVAAVVAEVSDDKALSKHERKRAQIEHAPPLSARARMVKLADKLDNLEGLTVRAPAGWGADRVRGYFAWAHAVVAGLRGANAALEAAVDGVFAREVRVGDESFRAVPSDPGERDRVLRDYLQQMAAVDD